MCIGQRRERKRGCNSGFCRHTSQLYGRDIKPCLANPVFSSSNPLNPRHGNWSSLQFSSSERIYIQYKDSIYMAGGTSRFSRHQTCLILISVINLLSQLSQSGFLSCSSRLMFCQIWRSFWTQGVLIKEVNFLYLKRERERDRRKTRLKYVWGGIGRSSIWTLCQAVQGCAGSPLPQPSGGDPPRYAHISILLLQETDRYGANKKITKISFCCLMIFPNSLEKTNCLWKKMNDNPKEKLALKESKWQRLIAKRAS